MTVEGLVGNERLEVFEGFRDKSNFDTIRSFDGNILCWDVKGYVERDFFENGKGLFVISWEEFAGEILIEAEFLEIMGTFEGDSFDFEK